MDLCNSDLLSQIVAICIAAATACVAYFAKQILSNQKDIINIHNDVKELTKRATHLSKKAERLEAEIEKNQGDQYRAHQEVTTEIARLSTIADLYMKPWDGVDRRNGI